jgi:starch synthase
LRPSLNILIVASEATPLVRTSYMGDVVSALPQALIDSGIQASIVIPRYKVVAESFPQECLVEKISIPIGEKYKNAGLYRTDINSLPVYLIDQPDYYFRNTLYKNDNGDFPDNAERFIFFSKAVVEMLPFYTSRPTILHCNDWQTGLVPLYLQRYIQQHKTPAIKSLFTVHNLANQGLFWRFDMHLTGLPWEYFTPEGIEFYGDINLLKAGLLYSDAVNTVSPRYCREIQTPEFGCGLEGVLQSMRKKLFGILNGADYSIWSPDKNTCIPENYDPNNLEGKKTCKSALISQMNLQAGMDNPLISMVSPLYSRKGLDLLECALKHLIERGIRVILQGIGDRNYVNIFAQLAKSHHRHFKFVHNFNQDQTQCILAGSDLSLKPSRFEPCGLNQIYSLRFGTIPIVHRTGGLDDTVSDNDPGNPGPQTGFKFDDYSPESLIQAVDRALAVFSERHTWEKLMKNAMNQDFSWTQSAQKYIVLYQKLLSNDGKRD